jgi:hypothetical protein
VEAVSLRYGQVLKTLARFGVSVGYDPHNYLVLWPASRVPYGLRIRLRRMQMGLNIQAGAYYQALDAVNGTGDLPQLPEHLRQFVWAAVYDEFPIVPMKVGTRQIYNLSAFVVVWLSAYATSYRRGEALEQLKIAHQAWLEFERAAKEAFTPEQP